MKKKVLLVHPKSNTNLVRMPFGLLYLASFLEENGCSCDIIDENTFIKNDDLSLQLILESNADIIGFTTYISVNIMQRVHFISEQVKLRYPKKIIVWGGYYTTGFPDEAVKHEFVDKVVIGPGEKALLNIVNDYYDNTLLLNKDKLLNCFDPKIYDDDLLFPKLNFNKLDVDFYLKNHDLGEGIFQYITSRGCYYSCRFCFLASSYGNKVFKKNIDDISNDLRYILNHHQVKALHFSDNMCFSNNQQALLITKIILDVTNGKGIEWRSTARINVLINLTADTYRLLKTSGCTGFSIGVESGSNDVLKLMDKKITEEQIHKALKILKENEFYTNTFEFILGYPGEQTKDELKTWKLICHIRKLFPLSTINLNRYFPVRSDKSEREGQSMLEYIDNYSAKYKVSHYANLPYEVLVFYTNKSKIIKSKRKTFKTMIRNLYSYFLLFRMTVGFFNFRLDYLISRLLFR